ncbi:MAG: hypothetical protein R2861_07050 [Desulfobacterales bacterium]
MIIILAKNFPVALRKAVRPTSSFMHSPLFGAPDVIILLAVIMIMFPRVDHL